MCVSHPSRTTGRKIPKTSSLYTFHYSRGVTHIVYNISFMFGMIYCIICLIIWLYTIVPWLWRTYSEHNSSSTLIMYLGIIFFSIQRMFVIGKFSRSVYSTWRYTSLLHITSTQPLHISLLHSTEWGFVLRCLYCEHPTVRWSGITALQYEWCRRARVCACICVCVRVFACVCVHLGRANNSFKNKLPH